MEFTGKDKAKLFIAGMKGVDEILALFPTAIFAVTKECIGKIHYLLLDKRPEVLNIQVKYVDDEIYIVLPAIFSLKLIAQSIYRATIFDIAMTGNVLLDSFDSAYGLKLHLACIQANEKRAVSFKKALHNLKEYSSYLSKVNSFSSAPLAVAILHKMIQDIYATNMPDTILKALADWSSKNVYSQFYEVLNEVGSSNLHIKSAENIFYYVDAREDYDEIIFCLLSYCNNEIEYLKNNNQLLFMYDVNRNCFLIKVKSIRANNPQLYSALGKISNCLLAKMDKRVMKFDKDELTHLQEEYNIKGLVFSDIEALVMNFCLNVMEGNVRTWNEKLAVKTLIEISVGFINSLDSKLVEQFTEYLLFSWRVKAQPMGQNFIKLNQRLRKETKRMQMMLESNLIVEFTEIESMLTKNTIADIAVKEFATVFLNKVKEFTATNNYELVITGEQDCFSFEECISKADVFLLKQLRNCLEIIAQHLGIKQVSWVYPAFVLRELVKKDVLQEVL